MVTDQAALHGVERHQAPFVAWPGIDSGVGNLSEFGGRSTGRGSDFPIPVANDSTGYRIAKRAFDLAFASLFLLLAAPFCLIVIAAIALTSPGPVLYRQERVGRGGRRFTCLKFRSMVDRAHEHRLHLWQHNEVDGPVFKMKADPRVTGIGKWLRKFSIDEIPQLVNVLRGEMSMVGPRPPLPEEVARYEATQLERLAVKPGLTCLWQVSGRSRLSFAEWVALDREYVRRRGFWFDLRIVLRTIPAVLLGRGAH